MTAMMEQQTQPGDSPTSQHQWIDHRIHEAINASLGPLQAQLAALTQHLANSTTTPQPQEGLQPPLATRTPSESIFGIDAAQLPQQSNGSSNKRKPLPNPPKYNGSRKGYAAWARQMRDKLELDAHYYNGNRDLWYLINSCLEEKPQQVVATFYAAGGPGGNFDPHEFMRYLDRTYKDSNIQSRAATSLRTLRQHEDQSLATFLPRFEQALAEAGGGDWPDSAKIVFLENALSSQLQRCLVTAHLPTVYQEWLSRVQEIAGKLEKLEPRGGSAPKEEKARSEGHQHGQHLSQDQDGDTKMAGVNKTAEKPGVPQQQRRCYRCGRTGHFVASCPAQVVFPENQKNGKAKVGRASKPKTSDSSEPTSETSEDEGAGKE